MDPSAQADPQTLLFLLRPVDGREVAGCLLALSEQEGVRIQTPEGDEVEAALADVIDLCAHPVPDRLTVRPDEFGWPRSFEVNDGQRIVGRCVGWQQDRVVVRHPWLNELSVPLHTLVRIGSTASPVADVGEPIAAGRGAPETPVGSAPLDRIRLLNGDVIRGTLLALDAGGVRIDTGIDEMLVDWAKVAEVSPVRGSAAMDPHNAPAGGRVHAHIELVDGSWLATDRIACEHQALAWLVDDRRVRIGMDRIMRIEIRGGRWEWLGDIAPAEVDSQSMFELDWPPRRNANVSGGPLSIGGRHYRRGIGVHAGCRLTYTLDGEYDTFTARIGLDDDAGEWAEVDVTVLVDGRTAYRKPGLRWGGDAELLRLDIAGARRLDLLVEAGACGDVQDRFDWAEAALIRTQEHHGEGTATEPAGRR